MLYRLLCPVEEMRVYGYVTTSKLKLMAVVEDTSSSASPLQGKVVEDNVKQLFVRIHELLVEYTLNPFNPIDGRKISSPTFDKRVSETVRHFNRT
jgi:trafficking protein particle complex subunit 2